MNVSQKKGVLEALKYPLFDAISKRRSRRFPMGATQPKGALKYVSKQKPVALDDDELALLCWFGAGITGSITSETIAESGNEIPSWIGHATPNPCNVPTTTLFFSHDKGTYSYQPKKSIKRMELETLEDLDRIIDGFWDDCIKVLDERVQMFPELLPQTINWNTNVPGSTVFIPVVDHTEEYINFASIVLGGEYGYSLVDDMRGNVSAGLEKFVANGDIKGPEVGLSSFESFMSRGIIIAPAYLMLEHIHLTAEAMGLGSVMFGGYTGEVMLGITPMSDGLGFKDQCDINGNVYACGLEGVCEGFCPPYYDTVDDAVDAFFEKKFGQGSPLAPDYKGVLPFEKDVWDKIKPKYIPPPEKHKDMVKAFLNYVNDTYGKFPATINPKLIPVWLQAHHIDIEFYDTFFAKDMITEAQRNHMQLWHGNTE